MPAGPQTRAYRFGQYDVDLRSRRLCKRGRALKLQDHAFQVLVALLENPGKVVTRDDLRRLLWPSNLYVDFAHGVTNAVHRLRIALNDPARRSSIIENVPSRGYRFVAAVRRIVDAERSETPSPAADDAVVHAHTRLPPLCRVNEKAHELYLKGRYCWNRRTPAAVSMALRFFQLSVEQAPEWAQSHAGLADAYLISGTWGYESLAPSQAYPRAKASAIRALELDPSLGAAHASLAISLVACDWDFRAAQQHYHQAIELDPGYATAHHWYALHLCDLRRFDDAVVQMQKAHKLDPVSLVIGTDLAHAFMMAGSYALALAQCGSVLELDPAFGAAHFQLGEVYLKMREYRRAEQQFCLAMKFSHGSSKCLSNLGHLLGKVNKKQQARRILRDLESRSQRGFLHCASLASIHAGLDESDAAVAWLRKACDQRFDPEVLQSPTFDELRPLLGFREVTNRVGLPL